MYAGLDVVSREMCGLSRGVSLDSQATPAAKDQTVRSPVVPAAVTEDVTPGAAPAASGSQTIGYADITITKSKVSPLLWNGEETLSVGGILNQTMINQFAQSIRALVNLVEIDLATTGYKGSSRAYGTPATAPFGTAANLTDVANVLKMLEDNGAPGVDLQLALGSAAIANIRGKQSGLFEINRAGNDDLLRRGVVGDLQSMEVRNSAGIQTPSIGSTTGYQSNLIAGYAVGDTSILLDTGSTADSLLAGDIITFAGDTNKYVVNTGLTGVSGTVILAEPGLRETLANDVAITIVAASTRNLGFARSALHLAARHPVMPVDANGKARDAADDVTTLTDLKSGLSFQVALYAQYRQIKYEVGLAWGTAVIKPEHIVTLLG
jgi:hypothetical protein